MVTRVYEDARRRIRLERDEHGVIHIEAERSSDLYWGMGYAHAHDRALQLVIMRILGEGRAAEILDGSDEMVAVDRFFRRMNWSGGLPEQRAALSPDTRAALQAYADGVNASFTKGVPWELRLVGHSPSMWSIEDSMLVSRMAGYLTLAQSQGEVERLIVQMVQAGISREKLEELFPGELGQLDVELVRKVRVGDQIVPDAVRWSGFAPRMMASNNWVVSGARSASGKPILANDPHLEVNRLPAVFQELVLRTKDRFAISATMPGVPALLLGRTTDLAWGATYTFMDAIDSWIEHCKDGSYRRGRDWAPFRQRTEVIRRKAGTPVEVRFYENEHGVLDGDPMVEGHYLATRWSGAESGARSLEAMFAMWSAPDVEAGMRHLGQLETAFNWVLADRHGAIGYQMSGLMPKRREGWSGLVPVAGWDAANDWSGFVDPDELPRCINPESGIFVTANQDLNEYGKAHPINACQGPYRAQRITELLGALDRVSAEDCCAIQQDLVSAQAPAFLEILRPMLPATPAARALASWDLRYDLDSRGAVHFEAFYRELRRAVFGANGLGDVVDFLADESGIFADFFINFDRVLLSERSAWFGGKTRDELFRDAAAIALGIDAPTTARWRDSQEVVQRHIVLGDKLPRVLGFDRGPVAIPGGRATVHQGQIYRSAGRTTSFAPAIRMVMDLAEKHCLTRLAGGPSASRFSKWYYSEMPAWIAGTYKKLGV